MSFVKVEGGRISLVRLSQEGIRDGEKEMVSTFKVFHN
jgi:hypothetical protein